MKKRDLLDMLGDIDPDMIDDAAPDFGKKRRNKRPQNTYMKAIAIAACCTLILCGAMVAAPMINKIVYPDVATTDTGETGSVQATEDGNEGNNAPSYEPTGAPIEEPTVTPTDEPIVEDTHAPTEAPTDLPIEIPTEQATSNEEEPTGAATEGATRPPTGGPIEEPTEGATRPPTGGPIELPTESVTDVPIEGDPYFGYISFTDDERFADYNISDVPCPSYIVGKNIATIKINRRYKYYNSDVVYEMEAEVNEIVGVDGEINLCYRIVKVDERLDLYVNCDWYYFMNSRNYQFSTISQLKEQIFDRYAFTCGQVAQYYKQTDEDYCRHFEIEGKLQDKVLDMIFSSESLAVDIEGGAKLEEIKANSSDSVRVYCYSYSLNSGWFLVFDSGYVCFSVSEIGDWLFKISENVARSIIDMIIYEGEPQGYVWNESQGKWYKIEFDVMSPYPTFNEVLEENKLMGQIEFEEEIDYWETKFHGWSPDILLLDSDSRMSVAEILYRADGDAVVVEDITKLSDEGMTFVCINNLTGNACYMTIYNSGHIRVDRYYYFVGTEYTNAILNVVRTNCTTYYVNASCFGWDEKKECWDTYDPKEDEIITEKPKGEHDYEWPTWEPDGEQSADAPDEYYTEAPSVEPDEMETERFENEYEVTE